MNKKELVLKTLANDTSMEKYTNVELNKMFWDEVSEWYDVIDECYLGNGPLEMAQEGADVIRVGLELKKRKAASKGATQAILGVLETFREVHIDPIDAIAMKLERNSIKYETTSPSSQNGHSAMEYHKAKRSMWDDMSPAFYYAYMMNAYKLYPGDE